MSDLLELAKGHYDHHRRITYGAFALIALGFILLVLGITGAIDLGLEYEEINATVANASPGAISMILGASVLGLQVRYGPRVTYQDGGASPGSVILELHETGPAFLLPNGAGIHLSRADRNDRGDHWYGEAVNAIFDGLGSSEHSESIPTFTIDDPDTARTVLAKSIDEWNRSANVAGQEDRIVEANVGGKWIGYEFKGGHTYKGRISGQQIDSVLALLRTLEREDESSPDPLAA